MSKLTTADLSQFTGTEQWFRHPICRKVLYTEGVQFVAERGGAYWLIDKIATLQMVPAIRAEEFQVWRLKVTGNTATLTCDDGRGDDEGNGRATLHTEHLTYTDFPLDEITLWVEGDTILLPSEH